MIGVLFAHKDVCSIVRSTAVLTWDWLSCLFCSYISPSVVAFSLRLIVISWEPQEKQVCREKEGHNNDDDDHDYHDHDGGLQVSPLKSEGWSTEGRISIDGGEKMTREGVFLQVPRVGLPGGGWNYGWKRQGSALIVNVGLHQMWALWSRTIQ